MTRRPIKNLATSVRQRLLNRARETGRPFNEMLQYFAMERFLYRLSMSPYAEKFEAMVKLGVLNSRMKDFFDIEGVQEGFEGLFAQAG